MIADVQYIRIRRTLTRVEDVDAEVIGTFTPQSINQLLAIEAEEPAEVGNRMVEARKPVGWPPRCWAITPDYDYYLVRIPRAK